MATPSQHEVRAHDALVDAIERQADEIHKQLKHVDTIDKSKPLIPEDVHVQKWPKQELLKEIESPHLLKHVESVSDRSSPKIEPTISIKLNEHGKLLQEIAAPHHLKHVDAEEGESAPQAPPTESTA